MTVCFCCKGTIGPESETRVGVMVHCEGFCDGQHFICGRCFIEGEKAGIIATVAGRGYFAAACPTKELKVALRFMR